MSNLIAFDDVVRLVNENEAFWADLGAHTPKTSRQGQQLEAFFRDRWNPWYARFMQVTARAHALDDKQQATFAAEAADGLVALRDVAGYQYQIGAFYDPPRDVDAELEKITEDMREMAYMLALNAGERASPSVAVHARRPLVATRHR